MRRNPVKAKGKMGNETTTANAGIRVSREGPALRTWYDGELGGYGILLAWRLPGGEERTDVTEEWMKGFDEARRDEGTRKKLAEHVAAVYPRKCGLGVLLKKGAPWHLPGAVVDVLDDVCREADRLLSDRALSL